MWPGSTASTAGRPPAPTLPAALLPDTTVADDDAQRLFIAFPVPAHVQAAIYARLEANAPGMVNALRGGGARWQRGTNLHATILFLGRASRGAVLRSLDTVARRARPIAARLSGFAHRGDATLRAMLDVPNTGLESLSDDVHAALKIEKRRNFSGHITLARLGGAGDANAGLGARCAAAAGGSGALIDVTWAVDRFALFSSPENTSSLYVVEREYALGAEKPAFGWLPAWFKGRSTTRMGARRFARQQAAENDDGDD